MLQDLVLLKVPVSWQEAVSVCLGWLEGHTAASCPDPAAVTINSIGELRLVKPHSLPGHPVQRAAEFLAALLADAAAPEPLRELLQADSTSTPAHGSLEEFTRALAYFERPDRRGDVATVHARGEAIFAKAMADQELERLRARAAREQESAPAKPVTASPWRAKVIQVAVVAGLSIAIAGGAMVLFTMAFAPPPARDDAGAELDPSTAASKLAAAVSEAKRLASAGLAKAISAAVLKKDEGPEPAVKSGPSRRARRSSATTAAVSGSSVSTDVATATGTSGKGAPAVEMVVSAKDVAAAVPLGTAPGAVEVIEVFASKSEPAYTSLDDVRPATLVRPQLPSRLVDGTPAPDASVLDITVNEAGRVEFVRLEGTRTFVNEKMLVSAAKAWLFEPAVRDGQPVRYRLRVQISE